MTKLNLSPSVKVAVVFFVLLGALPVSAAIVLSVGDVQVQLLPDRYYTMGTLYKAGQAYANNPNSGQGTVISFPNYDWAGSVHGNEYLKETNLFVDGVDTVITDGTTYQGSEKIVFHRRSCLGFGYMLNSTMTICGGVIEECVDLQGIDKTKLVEIFYGLQATRVNRLSKYAAYADDGTLLNYGTTELNNDSLPWVYADPGAIAVAQYDSNAQNGLLSVITKGQDRGLELFIWDRAADNKLYARFTDGQTTCGLNQQFTLKQVLVFFDAEPDSWRSAPSDIINRLNSIDPSVDINGDYRIDLYDLALLASQWLSGL